MGDTAIQLIMTRPEGANEAFLSMIPSDLRARLDIIVSPLIEIVATSAIPKLERDAGVIFTSANGVRFAPPGAGRPAFCVGQSTTAQAMSAGWAAVCVGKDAAELVSKLEQESPDMPLVLLGGVHARGHVAEKLNAAGLQVSRVEIYDQKLLPLSDKAQNVLRDRKLVIVALFSPRTAMQFANQCPPGRSVSVAALSPAIARALGDLQVAYLEIAKTPDARAMCTIVEKLIHTISLG